MSQKDDLISRRKAIDAIVNTVSEIGLHDNSEVARYGATFRQHEIINIIEGMPSAQPEIRTQMSSANLISRQAAIDLVEGLESARLKGEIDLLYPKVVKGLIGLPSAQPEIIYCKKCKHWTRTCGDEQWSLGDCDVFDKHLVMCNGYCAWAERREDERSN